MSDFSSGDILFVVLILCLIHGIMITIGWARRRKASREAKPSPDD